MRVSLDSNILVYSVDIANKAKQAQAIDLVRRAVGIASVLPEQCLFEFISVAMRKLGMPQRQAVQTVQAFARQFEIILPAAGVIDAATNLMAARNISIWDARFLAVCESSGVDTLLTEDLQDGGRYGSIAVINPFEPANAALVARLLPP